MTLEWLLSDKGAGASAKGLSEILDSGRTIPVAGCYDGLSALLAKQAGFEALYLSGAAVSASMALPDLGLVTMEEVVRAARSVVRATDLPLIVDCDTGFGEILNVMRTVQELEAVGASCIQIEDQIFPKKCGHLSDKKLIPAEEMCRKIAAARKASDRMLVVARTDAAMFPVETAIERARQYVDAGADIIFVEAVTSEEEILRVRSEINVPLLGNMTEFGRTPQITLSAWRKMGIELVIFPVSALRVAARALEEFYATLLRNGDVSEHLSGMMTRTELYERISYFSYEELDERIAKSTLAGGN